MSIKLTWYGHATWLISTGQHKILLDPFIDDSPTAPIKADELEVDFILVSHGHFDHVADVAQIANKNDAMVVAIFEIAEWFSQNHAIKNTTGMNIGGAVQLPFGQVKMTPALHSSQLPDRSYGGCPAGFVVTIDDQKIYFACDTGLFSDMSLIGDMGIDVAVLPIGDLFTMGPADSVAATKLVRPKQVLPAHFNTWPPIEQDANQWADMVRAGTSAEPILLEPGDSHEI
jgi:L-ascorbate metabolism protein UlaG (beta-lactamase superfamily)